jgi:asparagine synthetase B (glutamine-hydrolysing)
MINYLEDIISQNIRQIPRKPLSLLLSGGIDSSLVLALLRRVYPDITIYTFTIAKRPDYPDIIFAREVAKIFGTIHNETILSNVQFNAYQAEFKKIDKYSFKGDINVFILCKIAKTFSNIVVTGDGGDECFGGYWLHKYPLGHKETGSIQAFEEIHPEPRKHIEEMIRLGYRDCLFKDKSTQKDYESVWNYFIECLALKHLAPLLNTGNALDLKIFTPLWSESIISFMRQLHYTDRIGRRIEIQLAKEYLPASIIERESIGFDIATDF